MKRFKYLIAILLFSFSLVVNAEVVTYERTKENYRVPSDITVSQYNEKDVLNTPSVDESIKVYDFANLLSDSQEKSLFNSIVRFTNKTGLEAVIATIDDNPGKSVRDEAADFYDYNYFKTNGIIFLIDMDVREYAIVTTGSAMNVYLNTEIDIMLDNVYPYMANKNYYSACNSFMEDIDRYYSVQEDDYYYGDSYVKKQSIGSRVLNAFFGAGIVATVVILIMLFQCRMVRKANSSRSYLVEETKKIDNLGEIKTGSHTSRVRIQTSSGSSGGGSRSSSFSGSSGRSHGGGSRRF